MTEVSLFLFFLLLLLLFNLLFFLLWHSGKNAVDTIVNLFAKLILHGGLRIVNLFAKLVLHGLNGLVDEELRLALLDHLFLLRFIDALLQFVAQLGDALLNVLCLVGDEVGELVGHTLPLIRVVIVLLSQLLNKQESFLLVLSILLGQNGSEVCKDAQLGLRGVDFSLLHYLGIGVAHDGDQHVQHGQHRQERCHQEEQVCKAILGVVTEILRLKHSQSQHVLGVDEVQRPEA